MLRYFLMNLILVARHFAGLGTSVNSNYQPPSQPPRGGSSGGQSSGMAIATLILGIGSWTFLPVIGAVVGVILGWIELQNIKKGESPQQGKTITQIGFWLSIANIAFAVLGTCVMGALIIFVYGGMAAFFAAMGVAGV